MITQVLTDDDNINNGVLDLSVRKRLPVLLSPPSSTASSCSSSSMVSPKLTVPIGKRALDLPATNPTSRVQQTNKRPLRFQCKHCEYKAPSTSLMQNHIYRHTDLTPYSCAYCGHKSTTKSTIMVHIELCHPNMEVKIHENRVREQDFYRDLNSSEIPSLPTTSQEPKMKRARHSTQPDNEIQPINGVAIPMNTIMNYGNDLSPIASDELYDTDNLESMLLPVTDGTDDDNEQKQENEISPALKFKCTPPSTPLIDSPSLVDTKGSDSEDDGEYLLVYNRPKQFYGSLYEPDKQYACQLCTYTTNHRPSMEDHVFVHTNERPYKCGYCGEEIHTRYAATYHIKYKHPGMPRNFIQNKADITQFYVNRAKKEEEKNQFKVVDTRRVKVSSRNNKTSDRQQNKFDQSAEHTAQHDTSPSPTSFISVPPSKSRSPTPTPNTSQPLPPPDYRFLLAWSYYLATQAACLSPLLQQQGQSPFSLPTDPEAAAKVLQAMQAMMNPLTTMHSPNSKNEQNAVGSKTTTAAIAKEKSDKS
ncbi:unnamed protein product [Adineta ricciae]|uniref:C2H2-type domain-containing protein n=1 Tax=Adineta ricciae TaxID=249248 RepID=A0A816BGP6_ADIRI|nr:unnamed protein product [Adineta ricciae]CAF1611171.1 unnamed protein product [Adineta ricciae]